MIEGTTTTKALGVALRTLYPNAFVSYQGVIFKVISPGSEILSGITEDSVKSEVVQDILDEYPELAEKIFRTINKEIEKDTGLPLPEKKGKKIRVKVPGKIDLRIDDTLDKVYCTNRNCGTIWKIAWLKQRSKGLPKCLLCGYRVQQAPIFVPVIDSSQNDVSEGGIGTVTDGNIQPLHDSMVFCHYKKVNGRCTAPTSTDNQCVTEFRDQLGSLAIFDPQRPIESLKRFNPDCPKNLDVPPIDIRRPPRHGNIWFSMDFPRESLNMPLSASAVVSYDKPDDDETADVNDVLVPMLGQFFRNEIVDFEQTKFMHMKLLETVWGYRVGSRTRGATVSYIGMDTKTIIGRSISTKGFQITIKNSIYNTVDKIKRSRNMDEEEEEILEVILHSLKHALLVEVPIFTGLDENKFHGTFEINPNRDDDWAARVYLYDTEDGGGGGFSTIMSNRDVLETMLDNVRLRRINCPVRDCHHACKHCLFIKNCGFVNRRLHRRILKDAGIFQLE